MSSSQQTHLPQDVSDLIMEDGVPDSPPENPSFLSSSSHLQSPTESSDTNYKANSSRSNGDAAGAAKVNHGAPGSSWSTKKWQEEYDRAMNSVLDQNWDSTKFGDPLLK